MGEKKKSSTLRSCPCYFYWVYLEEVILCFLGFYMVLSFFFFILLHLKGLQSEKH